MTVSEAGPLPLEAEEFLSWLAVERGRAVNTLAAYRGDLKSYWAFVSGRGATSLAAVSPADVDAFAAMLTGAGHAPTSVARRLVAVRTLHQFLVAEELADLDPTEELETPRPPVGLPKPLSEADIERLLAAAAGEDPMGLRDRAILELLYGTGARISEAAGTSLADLDLTDRLLRLRGKGGKERVVPVGGPAADALTRWLAYGRPVVAGERRVSRNDADAVFIGRGGRRLHRSGIWRRIRAVGLASGLGDRLTPHSLRHSCATHMVDHGADVRTVQELLGHASITTTQVYTKVSTARLRQVYEAAHPRAVR